MWLSAHVRQRAGALSASAELFLEEWLGNESAAYRGGQAGLVALCRQLERFAYRPEVDEEMERRFVEGAGALLGVLLIEHVPGACHASRAGTHRIRLGSHGFFDPFAAVDRALDAPDIRRGLAREVERAEAEACARGPISRVVSALCQLLAAERPDLNVTDQFECTLQLRQDGADELLELDLRRAVETTQDQRQAAVDNVARRLLSMLPGGPGTAGLAFADARARMLPRLARSDAVRDLTSLGKSVLFAAPLSEELVVALLVEYEGRARYLREAELTTWGIDSVEALALSVDNLRAKSDRARIVREQLADGMALVGRTGDGRDAARVLLPELYEELARRVGPRVCVALPHRDAFFACDARCAPLVERVARRAADDAARAPHALSARLFELTSDGLRAFGL